MAIEMKRLFPIAFLLTALLPVAILLMSGPGFNPDLDLAMAASLVGMIIMASLYLYLRIAKGSFSRDIIGNVAVALVLLFVVPIIFVVVCMMITGY